MSQKLESIRGIISEWQSNSFFVIVTKDGMMHADLTEEAQNNKKGVRLRDYTLVSLTATKITEKLLRVHSIERLERAGLLFVGNAAFVQQIKDAVSGSDIKLYSVVSSAPGSTTSALRLVTSNGVVHTWTSFDQSDKKYVAELCNLILHITNNSSAFKGKMKSAPQEKTYSHNYDDDKEGSTW